MPASRRHFLLSCSASPLLAAVSDQQKVASSERLFPKALAKGQTVALIAPASNAGENEEIRYAADILSSFGLQVKMGKHLFERWGYLAGTDKQRAQDLMAAFSDPEVDAIVALRGGYGTMRILPYLDFATIQKNPKVLMGYSDLTALLNAIHLKTGLITFHGPVAKQEFSEYTLKSFKEVLFEGQAPIDLASPPPYPTREGRVERHNRLLRIHPGQARGQLVGGNLSLLAKICGTPYAPDYSGKIVFIEEVGEDPYRVDGMLTQLILSESLTSAAGIVFGKCTNCDPENPYSHSFETVLRDRLGGLGIPCISGMMIGHISNQSTMPIGCEAQLDVAEGRLTLLESPVKPA